MKANKIRTATWLALITAVLTTFVTTAQSQTSGSEVPSHYNLLDLGLVANNSIGGLNDAGQATGGFTTSAGAGHAFRTQPNAPINPTTDDLVMDPNIRGAYGVAINNSGEVTGGFEETNSSNGIFRTAPNSPINLSTDVVSGTTNTPDRPNAAIGINSSGAVLWNRYLPGASLTIPDGTIIGITGNGYSGSVNDSGQVVGHAFQPNNGAFRTSPYSAFSPSTDSLGTQSQPNAINNSGQVVGSGWGSSDSAYRTAPNSTFNPATDYLATLGGNAAHPYAINGSGLVVGAGNPSSGRGPAFVFSRGVVYDLNTLVNGGTGVELTVATAINDSGQILALGSDNHAYLLTPANDPIQCQVSGIAGSPNQLIFTIQDAVSGVQIIAVSSSTNASTSTSQYSAGTKAPVIVTASPVDSSQIAAVRLSIQASDGRTRSCGSTILPEPAQWIGRGGIFISNVAVASDGNGGLEVFALGSDQALWYAAQPSPAAAWSAWTSLGGASLTGSPAAATDSDGRIEVFVISSDNTLWNIAQTAPGNWSGSGFQNLAAGVKDRPAAVRNSGGKLLAFVRTINDELAFVIQTSAGSSSWQPLNSLGGVITSNPAAVPDTDGSVQAFAAGSDQALWHAGLNPDGSVMPWSSLGGVVKGDPSVVAHAGAVYAFIRGSDDALWFKSELNASAWSDWTGLGGQMIGNPEAAINAHGHAEAFVVGVDNALWHIAQSSPGSILWNAWSTLGGYLNPNSLTVRRSESIVNVFGVGGDSELWEISQPLPGTWD